MRTEEQVTNNKFLNIKVVKDPDNHVNGYQFAERLGVDSIAFICYDKNTDRFLLNDELKPPIGQFLLTAFGGSLDKNSPMIAIVRDEVREEAGFIVRDEDIHCVGRAFVSTQMNQFCHLFIVMVDANDELERKPENAIEAMAKTVWIDVLELLRLEDWKAITIIAKAKSLGILKG